MTAALDLSRLGAALDEATRDALASGALAPIVTDAIEREDGGAVFSIRKVSTVAAKRRPAASNAPRRDPFSPPDPALVLGALGGAHLALLNKFPVLARHLLIVTRAFAPQEALVDEADFAALLACLDALPALGFYNGGRDAGASQPHKHLQVVPFPLGGGQREDVPVAPLLARAEMRGEAGVVPAFAFAHAFARAPVSGWTPPLAHERFASLLTAAGVRTEGPMQRDPYNLLVTREWMLVVARAKERCDGVSVNSLGFAGSFFCGTDAELETITRRGPLAVLRDVSARGR